MGLFTIDDLHRIMRGAGFHLADADADRPIEDISFSDLDFDSLALLETFVRISTEFGVKIPDEAASEVTTPAALVTYVNDRLVGVR